MVSLNKEEDKQREHKDGEVIISTIKCYIDGHINESVERHNFRRCVQQSGEAFDDFLVALHELVKTRNFCSSACMEKSIRDQIIEGILDGDIIEHFLQQQKLILDTAITMYRAEEATKKQRSNITLTTHDTVLALQRQKKLVTQFIAQPCPSCGGRPHQGGQSQCPKPVPKASAQSQCPAYNITCHYCQKVGYYARV